MKVKRGQLGDNADNFMPIISADAPNISQGMWTKLEPEIQFVKNVPYPTQSSK